MKKKIPFKQVRNLDEVGIRWVELRHEIEGLAAELKELEKPIKETLKDCPNRERKFGPHLLFLTKDSERNNFDRELAIKTLGAEALEPFFSKSSVEGHIRVK